MLSKEIEEVDVSSYIFRMFEYDTQIALKDGVVESGILIIVFPNSAVIYLRHNPNTPEVFTVRMLTPGGEVSYPVPVMKVQEYTIDEIFKSKLLFLIPFYIFSYGKSFDTLNQNKEKLTALEEEFLLIRRRLEELCADGEITEYIKCTILDMTKKVVESIARNHEAVKEGVKQVVGGRILEYEAKDILRRGISQGRREGEETGIKKGEINMCIQLIHDGLLKIEDAARKLNMEEEELKKHL